MVCQRVLLCFFCVFSLLCPLSISLASGLDAAPLGTIDFSGSGAALQVLRGAPEYTSISLSSSNLVTEDKTLGYQTSKSFGIPGEPFIMEEGVPEVPLVAPKTEYVAVGKPAAYCRNSTYAVALVWTRACGPASQFRYCSSRV